MKSNGFVEEQSERIQSLQRENRRLQESEEYYIGFTKDLRERIRFLEAEVLHLRKVCGGDQR